MAVALIGWTLLALLVCKEDEPVEIEAPKMDDCTFEQFKLRPNPTLDTFEEAEAEKERSEREASNNGAEAAVVDLSSAISDY